MKPTYIKLVNKRHPDRYVHVPVLKGQFVTDKHGFVIPMRHYNGFKTISVDILKNEFEAPRVLSC